MKKFINRVGRFLFDIALCVAFDAIEKAKERAEFERKYKKVIKINSLGFKSVEYHEREEQ